jgi:hypothetical protein
LSSAPEAVDGAAVVDEDAAPDDASPPEAAAGRLPGDAEASTRETARKPRPMAAAADAVHAAPRVRVRFMPVTLPPRR